MIYVLDHLKEKESVLEGNARRIRRALERGEGVTVFHPVGKVHGRLANIPGVIYVESRGLGVVKVPAYSGEDHSLLDRLTSPNETRMAVKCDPKGSLFIHWFYRDRVEDRLGMCEIFHLNMLRYFNVMDRVDAIHIRCAWDGEMTDAMREAVRWLECGHAKVDFRVVRQKDSWEHDTIKEAAECAIRTGEFVYYTHFKGVTRVPDPLFGGSVRGGYGALDIYYWSWLMYWALFNAPEDAIAVGPMLRNGINKSYSYSNIDISWSALKGELYHYVGSFQGFDGAELGRRLGKMGLGDISARARKLWIGDRYTVEMFLSLVFGRGDVHTAYIIGPEHNYNLYAENRLPYRKAMFQRIYADDAAEFVPEKVSGEKAVITCLYGSHSILREPLVIDEGVKYICVTDNASFKAPAGSAWRVIYDPWKEFGGRFRHMNAKFRPFRYTDTGQALYIDSSIQITGSVLPLFELASAGVLLKHHSSAKTIGEELARWPKLRGMPVEDVKRFAKFLPLVEGSLGSRVYGGDVCLWRNTVEARRFGEMVLALVEGAGVHEPFMSNQLCVSALAAKMFAGIVGRLPVELPMRKFRHNTWEEISKWM